MQRGELLTVVNEYVEVVIVLRSSKSDDGERLRVWPAGRGETTPNIKLCMFSDTLAKLNVLLDFTWRIIPLTSSR